MRDSRQAICGIFLAQSACHQNTNTMYTLKKIHSQFSARCDDRPPPTPSMATEEGPALHPRALICAPYQPRQTVAGRDAEA